MFTFVNLSVAIFTFDSILSKRMVYLHDDNEDQLGCKNMPILQCVGVLFLMARRVAVVMVPA